MIDRVTARVFARLDLDGVESGSFGLKIGVSPIVDQATGSMYGFRETQELLIL